ncbi:transposase [Methanosarcina sp. UBA5]|uniref:transposase n=1 Tax=Methanosarcina sp. UBA5 TaxID=1915593 RepID=UPI0025FAD72D|nr:transposase [Methanosarcina sp. UBA5]
MSVLVDLQGLHLSIIIVPANKNDSTHYIPTLKNFNIKRPVGRPVNRPSKVTTDAMYDTAKIRKYNRRRGIESNIPVNKRNRKKMKRRRSIKVNKEEYKKKRLVERFFSWIESCKKVFPIYEIKEKSYLGVVMVAAIIRLNELLG